jgi:hypothetical protein
MFSDMSNALVKFSTSVDVGPCITAGTIAWDPIQGFSPSCAGISLSLGDDCGIDSYAAGDIRGHVTRSYKAATDQSVHVSVIQNADGSQYPGNTPATATIDALNTSTLSVYVPAGVSLFFKMAS